MRHIYRKVSHDWVLDYLKSSPQVKIVVHCFGENLGMDFGYFDLWHLLRRELGTRLHLTLCRANVDETNCIGFDRLMDTCETPLDAFHHGMVKQKYPDGRDWVQHLTSSDLSIFPASFKQLDLGTLLVTIGMANSEAWLSQFSEATCDVNTLREAVRLLLPPCKDDAGQWTVEKINPWDRNSFESHVIDSPDYPVKWRDTSYSLAETAKDYLRVSLRWPDNVRWYYTIDRQFQVLHDIVERIKQKGRPPKIIFNLKDLDLENNFNRGQTLRKIRDLKDVCNDFVCTYAWVAVPRPGRPTLATELEKLRAHGLRNIRQVNVLQDLRICSAAKVYLSEPAGMAELIGGFRKKPESTFTFPVGKHHLGSYALFNVGCDMQPRASHLKVHPVVQKHSYKIHADMSATDDPLGYRTLRWHVEGSGAKATIGENLRFDDHLYFEAAQETVFRQMYENSRCDLIEAVAETYCS